MNLLFLLPFAKNCCKMICIIGIITKNENKIFITKMFRSPGQCLPATYFLHLSIQTHYERPASNNRLRVYFQEFTNFGLRHLKFQNLTDFDYYILIVCFDCMKLVKQFFHSFQNLRIMLAS